jgi:hypothetical protein
VQLDDPLHDRQSDPRAFALSIELFEQVEDAFVMLRGNAEPLISNVKDRGLVADADFNDGAFT